MTRMEMYALRRTARVFEVPHWDQEVFVSRAGAQRLTMGRAELRAYWINSAGFWRRHGNKDLARMALEREFVITKEFLV